MTSALPANPQDGGITDDAAAGKWGTRWPRRTLGIGWGLVTAGSLYFLFVGVGFTLIELSLFVLGLLALWLPLGGTFYILLRGELVDKLDRFTFSALASYSLTTLLYFGVVECHIGILFYIIQAVLLAWILRRAVKSKARRTMTRGWSGARCGQITPLLGLIVVASLITCVKYNTFLHELPDGSALLATYHDNTGHVGYAYELSRHIPPSQNIMRAGQPEHAYHCFPEVTVALIGRFTFQHDLMRANLVYGYIVTEILTCLSLFCLGRWLSGRAGGGYVAAALMFVFVYPFPEFVPSYLHYFFFTLDPHVSSLLEPMIVTSCQAFCSVPLCYAIALGLLAVGRHIGSGGSTAWMPLLLGLMVAAEMRFRIHIYLPLLPAFLFLMLFFWICSRRWSFVVAVVACLFVSALLFSEMRSPVYLKSSSQVVIGYNGLARSVQWMNMWPFHREVQDWLLARLGDNQTFNWTWQVVCISAFAALNVCGIPMMIAVVLYLRRTNAWVAHLPITVMMLSLMLGSIAGGVLLNTTYDPYSLGGEMPINVAMFGFPFYCLLVWEIAERAWKIWNPSAIVGSYAAIVLLVFAVLAQYAYPTTEVQKTMYTLGGVKLTRATRDALAYLRDQTPPDSVVASANMFNPRTAIYSGIGGRACYVEYFNFPALDSLPGVIPTQKRLDNLARIWGAGNEVEMRKALDATPINYLVEFADRPLWMHPQSCLSRAWAGYDPDGSRVAIWRVLPPVNKPAPGAKP